MILLDGVEWGHELDSVIHKGPFPLSVFCDLVVTLSVLGQKIISHSQSFSWEPDQGTILVINRAKLHTYSQ